MKKKICAALLAATVSVGAAVVAPVSEAASRAELAAISVNRSGSNFQYWNKKSESFRALTGFVKDVTNPESKNYIPVEDRIAVFDLDGTLLCETTPSYFEWMLYLERALNDPTYDASFRDRDYARMVKGGIYHIGIPNPIEGTGLEYSPNGRGYDAPESLPKDLDRGQAQSQESVFAGLTLPEYEAYVKSFMKTPAEGMKNLLRGESFYMPMVEVVSYLHANKFKVFIVSGSDRQTLRVLVNGVLPIESDNIIGTDIMHVASHQGDKDGLDYLYEKNDEVVRGQFILKDVKMNKVSNIVREIGKQPVLAFGNSSGDSSMFNYTITGNKYKSLAFALLCDDTERELGNMQKAEKMLASCKKYGWIPVSMRNDFKTIYGDNVTRADR
ncbi:MAG: haloacid dehalogenase-like hydrolase [Schwartzia sp.]|nr:haloacid dehalogenase-like hydrolase [Schwartzia sp. (in: firmicutes)]